MSGWKYNWKLEYADGTFLDRRDNNRRQEEDKEDPNNPTKLVSAVKLEPVNSNMPTLVSVIPSDASPVVHKQVMKVMGGNGTDRYRIGFSHAGVRIMIAVDPLTNLITQEMDILKE